MPTARRGDDDPQRRGRVRDASGRTVRLLDAKKLFLLRRHDVIEESALEAIMEELEPGAARNRRFAIVVLAIVVPLVIIGIGIDVVIEGQPAVADLVSTITNPAIIAALVGGCIVPIFAARKQRFARLRRVMLRHRRCPHCGYGLTGVPPHDDGATVCPECACAWRLDDADLATAEPMDQPRRVTLLIALIVLTLGAFAGVAVMLWFTMR